MHQDETEDMQAAWLAMLQRHMEAGRRLQARALEALEAMDAGDIAVKEIRDWLRAGLEMERDGMEAVLKGPPGAAGAAGPVPPLVIAGGDRLEDQGQLPGHSSSA